MCKFTCVFVIAFSYFAFSQTMSIHSTDGTVTQRHLSEIDSITFSTSESVDDGLLFGDFGITDSIYADQSDWDQIVQNIFGDEYRVADWNDLLAFYSNSGDLLALFDGLGLTEYQNSAAVTRNGVRNYSSTRFYFTSRHEHNKPGNYLAHDHIDNYLISLGSWWGSRKIMVHKK